MDAIHRLRNRLRHGLRSTMLGRALSGFGGGEFRRVQLVTATRLTEAEFWKKSALGRSLRPWMNHPDVALTVRAENSAGLPEVYNDALAAAESADAIVFLHDDVWIQDAEWLSKLRVALRRYDVVGVAGNTRRSPRQPAWLFSHRDEAGQFHWDHPHLSGSIAHGQGAAGPTSVYGAAPAACELLDGVFLAARVDVVRRSDVRFDPRFAFDFYDMDFCRRARAAGLELGTWPIGLTHQSSGGFGGERWEAALRDYLAKWKS